MLTLCDLTLDACYAANGLTFGKGYFLRESDTGSGFVLQSPFVHPPIMRIPSGRWLLDYC